MEPITLSEELIEAAQEAAKEDECSLSEQIEHWSHIGRLLENNPDVTYDTVMDILDSIEQDSHE